MRVDFNQVQEASKNSIPTKITLGDNWKWLLESSCLEGNGDVSVENADDSTIPLKAKPGCVKGTNNLPPLKGLGV